ncbi:heavy-metal-associated domain-containing protein [Papillibacter cinnamivorans]|uniref:Copper chaperone CopZ n=1 Tax=Papillibacter cinnamivorans DSM 12816 TaxID=1122930 RepID=A0A1W2AAR1_9FIRM|nr:heavy-metal-associated domain-containing protein [Papillibacter cinnamivorans]SMC57710.1 Copper chaperone CopZ [Papillibacter cinnamivorans DSM 12816]
MSIQSAYYHLPRMNGAHEAKEIKRELSLLPGVKTVSVNRESHQLAVDFDSTGSDREQIEKTLGKLGLDFARQKEPDELQ